MSDSVAQVVDTPSDPLDKVRSAILSGEDSEPAEQPEPPVVPDVPVETPAEPAPAADWMGVKLPEDLDHGFYRSKTVGDLYKGIRHLEPKLQQVSEENTRLRAELAAIQVAKEYVAQHVSQPPPPDAWAERGVNPDEDIIADPRKVLAASQEATMDRVRPEIESVRAELVQLREERQREIVNQRLLAGQQLAHQALTSMGFTSEAEQTKAMRLLLPILTDFSLEYAQNGGPENPANWEAAYRYFVGEPPAARTVADTPPPTIVEQGNPPGSKRAAPTRTSAETVPSLKSEERAIANRIQEAMGLKNGEEYQLRVAQRIQEMKRK